MDILFKIMLFLHLTSLGVGATANVAMPLLGRQLATGTPAAKPSLGAIAGQISLYSRWAFGVLIVTGIAMMFMRYNGDAAGLGVWFMVKMALVLVLFVGIVLSVVAPTAIKPPVLGMIMRVALLGVIASAVLTFG